MNIFLKKRLQKIKLFAIIILFYGDVAQLARAHGSYPWCREFESPRRYHICVPKS